MSTVEDKLRTLGLELPSPPTPGGTYVPSVTTGNLIYLSGVTPKTKDGRPLAGKVGTNITTEDAYKAAQKVTLGLLANLKQQLGSLEKVRRIVKVFGMVNADPEYTNVPGVINGCSDLLIELFGENGRHSRSAVGLSTLPGGSVVEIEMIVEIRTS